MGLAEELTHYIPIDSMGQIILANDSINILYLLIGIKRYGLIIIAGADVLSPYEKSLLLNPTITNLQLFALDR